MVFTATAAVVNDFWMIWHWITFQAQCKSASIDVNLPLGPNWHSTQKKVVALFHVTYIPGNIVTFAKNSESLSLAWRQHSAHFGGCQVEKSRSRYTSYFFFFEKNPSTLSATLALLVFQRLSRGVNMGSLLSLLNLQRNATLKCDIFVDFESKSPFWIRKSFQSRLCFQMLSQRNPNKRRTVWSTAYSPNLASS